MPILHLTTLEFNITLSDLVISLKVMESLIPDGYFNFRLLISDSPSSYDSRIVGMVTLIP